MADYTSIGYGVNVADSGNLGYIETPVQKNVATSPTSVSISSIAVTAADKAAAVWSDYVVDLGETTAWTTAAEGRAQVAAYYYGLEAFAEELLRMRIGNIGAAANSPVAEALMNKALTVMGSAQAGIKAYEEWCFNEAKVAGAKAFNLISDALSSTGTGIQAAQAHWDMIANDAVTSVTRPPLANDTKFIVGIGYAYTMQIMGAKVAQRALGYTGARNKEVGAYYQRTAQTLIQNGAQIAARFDKWSADAKPQHTIMAFGI